MTIERDFVSMITKLTEDFNHHKRQCFKYGSKQLTTKLLDLMDTIEEDIQKSIEVVEEELKNTSYKSVDTLWEKKVDQVLQSNKHFGEREYLTFLHINYRDLQRLVREHARTKYIYSLSLDKIIGLLPEYNDKTPEFPKELVFLGILSSPEDFFCNETIPARTKYYQDAIKELLDDKHCIDTIFRAKLEIFLEVQKKSLEEVQKNRSFLLKNSIDDISTVRHFAKFCKEGYLDSLD